MPSAPQAGKTHDITTTRGGTTTGWMLEPGSYKVRRANNFAPKISSGQLTHNDLDMWPTIDISDFSHGLGAEYLRNDPNRFFYTTGFGLETAFPERVTMASSSTNSDTFAVNVYMDFGNLMYAGGGTSIRKYDPGANTWANSVTGLASAVLDMRVFNNKLYAALGDINDMQSTSDGITWAAVTGKKARCYAVWKNLLYRGTGNSLISFDGTNDVVTTAVGDPGTSATITSIIPQTGYLIIFKSDGKVYTYDGTTVSDFTTYPAYSGNFQYPAALNGAIYYGVLSSVYRMTAAAGTSPSVQPITPNKPDDIPNGWGLPVSFTVSPNYVYCLFSSASGFANLLKWNGQGWHITLIASGAGTACYYSRVSGMVWANIGGASWFTKLNTQNDTPPPNNFPTTGGPYYVYLPHMTANLDDIDKAWRDVKIIADNLSPTVTLTLDYQADRSGTWVNFGTATASPQQTIPFAINNVIIAKDMWIRIGFSTNSGSVTPVLKYVSIAYQPRPKAIYSISGQVIIDNNIHLLDGSGNDPNNATQLLAELMSMADFSGVCTLVGMDGITYYCMETSVGWVESLRGDQGKTFRAPVTWLQAVPNTVILSNSPALGQNILGTGTIAWLHPENIGANDLALAYAYSNGQTNYLEGTQYGFNVPASATILGISVDIAGWSDGSFPTSQVNNGGGQPAWQNPTNADIPNQFYATVSLGANQASQTLYVSGYGLSIPGGATINGIYIKALIKYVPQSGGGNSTGTFYLGARKSLSVGAMPQTVTVGNTLTPTWITVGGSSDLWGTTWTAADINGAGFGVFFSCANSVVGDPMIAYVDAIQIIVYYNATDTLTAGSVVDTSVLLLKAGGAAGVSQPLGGNWTPRSSMTTLLAPYRVHGGATSLWGTTWTPADINNAGFGAAVVTTNTNVWAFVDHLRITVYYNIT